jgi:5'-nucleotidase
MEIMNYLAPDVVSLGNHEFDYGLPQLLFLEKMANFPIITANLYIKQYGKRLMKPYLIINKDGFDLMFIGILTDKVIDAVKQDKLVGSFISLEDAAHEVGIITDAYKNDDIDLTVLLTHIGYESDIELAKLLKPEWGVDMIIGGHSHTILQQPAKVNNVLIAQAGVGTNQIGRFDIIVDDDTNSIIEWKWQLIPIEEGIAEPDMRLKEYIAGFADEVDRKYNTIICKFTETLTHPKREIETSLGNLFADALAEMAECDVMLVGSGSIRSKELGPAVMLGDYRACFPYNDYLSRFIITGAQLKRVFTHIMRPENRNSEGECYQVNGKIRAVYNDEAHDLISLSFAGSPVIDELTYTIGLIGYHIANSAAFLNITNDELLAHGNPKVVVTSVREVVEEYFKNHQNTLRQVEGRLTYE